MLCRLPMEFCRSRLMCCRINVLLGLTGQIEHVVPQAPLDGFCIAPGCLVRVMQDPLLKPAIHLQELAILQHKHKLPRR
jgi:hypothetical protein